MKKNEKKTKMTKKTTCQRATHRQAPHRQATKGVSGKGKPEAGGARSPKASRVKASSLRPAASSLKLSALDAAAQVLAKAEKPMRAQELIAAMAEQGLWKSPAGKTPHATLYAAMMREERDKGGDSRFHKVDRGMFQFNKAGA